MNEITRQIAELSPERRALLQELLKKQGIDLTESLIVPVKRDGGGLPLSFSQQRLWFLEQLDPGSPVYVIPCVVRVRGEVDVALLEQSLNDLVQRHEVLRTTFASVDDQPVQVIAEDVHVPVRTVDLGALAPGLRDEELSRLVQTEIGQPFDLSRGPLVRATLVRMAEKESVLLLPMHHIVSDGWSTGVMLHELRAFYEARRNGVSPDLPDLRIQYADFAAWQRAHMTGSVLDSQLAYWREQLADCPDVLDVVTDYPRPAVQTSRGSMRQFSWDAYLTRGVNELARREHATPFMVLLAIFQVLLYRITRQADVAVGTPVANRNRTETEPLIGFFVNTVVLRSRVSGNPPFRRFLAAVRDMALGAFAHQELPFEVLVERLNPRRDLSTTPFFQVMFVLNNAPIESLSLGSLELEPVEVDTGTAKFDLVLSMMERQGMLGGKMEFATDLFRFESIERLLDELRRIAEAVVEDPDVRIDTIPLMSAADRTRSIVAWNRRNDIPPEIPFIHELIEQQSRATPDTAAVVSGSTVLTYGELNERANRLARLLRIAGIGPDGAVGVFLERSPDSILALLAVLKAGGVYLPLDVAYPRERLAFMMEDTGARAVVATRSMLDRLPPCEARTLVLDAIRGEAESRRADEPWRDLHGDNLAYVIYTSGSTGTPKGVGVPHRALSLHTVDLAAYYRLMPNERVMQFSAMNFDASLEQILTALIAGATLVMRPQEIWSALEFRHQVDAHDVTVINLPTAYWAQLLQDWKAAPELIPSTKPRLMIVGGDQILAESVRLWRASSWRDAVLLNAYGPTETVITAAAHDLSKYDDEGHRRVPIGTALSQRSAYVLDPLGEPVPAGVPGELHIGGECLARGYVGSPALTSERFVPDHLSSCPGGRLYRTGDLVRYQPDGTLEFLGRVDQQVKVRGFRVEPGEIESVLITHASIRECAVTVLEDVPGEKRLAAYVVLRQGEGTGVSDIREFLKSKLPDHMMPSVIVALPALPLNAVGKIDRRALPRPERERRDTTQEYVAPRTPVEESVAAIVAETLSLAKVGVRDNFFDLGGHSMLATQVLSRVRRQFGVGIPLRSIFETPTVEGLALAITRSQAASVDPSELEAMLADLENISEEEAAKLVVQAAAGNRSEPQK